MKLEQLFYPAFLFLCGKAIADFCSGKLAIGIPEIIAVVIIFYVLVDRDKQIKSANIDNLIIREQQKEIEDLTTSNKLKDLIIAKQELRMQEFKN